MFRRIQYRLGSVNLRTYLRRLSARWLWLVPVFGLLPHHTSAASLYDLNVIVKTGGSVGGFAVYSIKDNPTINDNGHVAFVASVQGGSEALVRWDGTQNELLSVAFNGTFGSAAINDSDKVATRFSATSGGNSLSTIRRYSGATHLTPSPTQAARG